jgi:uncharacterized protein involved in exopolysaccharide biosynthesis
MKEHHSKAINVRDFLDYILRNFLQLILFSSLVAVIFYFYASTIPNTYVSSAILKVDRIDNQSNSNISNGGLLSSFSGFGNAGDKDTTELIKRITSITFYNELMKDEDLEVKLAAIKSFDKKNNTEVYDKEIYSKNLKKWVVTNNNERKYSSQAIFYKFYLQNLSVSIDKDSGLVMIAFEHPSPNFASDFINELVNELNIVVANEKINQAQSKIDYINTIIESNQKDQVKVFLNKMLEEEYKSLLLFAPENNKPYKLLDYPVVPEIPSYPNKIIHFILGFFFGLFLLSSYLSFRYVFISSKA